jgi:hypothetical protein
MAGTAKKLYRNPHFFAYDEDCTSVGRVSLRDAIRGVKRDEMVQSITGLLASLE